MNNILLLNRCISSFKVAYINNNKFFVTKSNKLIIKVLNYLRKNSLIIGYKVINFNVKVYLKYIESFPFILRITNCTTPSHEVKLNVFQLKKFSRRYPNSIVLTKFGIMSSSEAILCNQGGVVLFHINFYT